MQRKCYYQSLRPVDLGSVPPELVGCFNLIFSNNAEDAVFKSLGWNKMDRLKSITIKGFKKFQSFNMNFNEHLNILVGENESGKSTLLEAIKVVLNRSNIVRLINRFWQSYSIVMILKNFN